MGRDWYAHDDWKIGFRHPPGWSVSVMQAETARPYLLIASAANADVHAPFATVEVIERPQVAIEGPHGFIDTLMCDLPRVEQHFCFIDRSQATTGAGLFCEYVEYRHQLEGVAFTSRKWCLPLGDADAAIIAQHSRSSEWSQALRRLMSIVDSVQTVFAASALDPALAGDWRQRVSQSTPDWNRCHFQEELSQLTGCIELAQVIWSVRGIDARQWLTTPQDELNRRRPLDCIGTEFDRNELRAMLVRMPRIA
ncbi:MAG: DUF2384 domain-containing protein [Bdellovibrionales bacterium]|nr:DUF2384 domain-containing protein [Bdellovibrionales bacterium]